MIQIQERIITIDNNSKLVILSSDNYPTNNKNSNYLQVYETGTASWRYLIFSLDWEIKYVYREICIRPNIFHLYGILIPIMGLLKNLLTNRWRFLQHHIYFSTYWKVSHRYKFVIVDDRLCIHSSADNRDDLDKMKTRTDAHVQDDLDIEILRSLHWQR